MYYSSSGLTGFLVLLAILFIVVSLIFAAGSFLLGTPIGLAILGLLIIRHYWRRHQLQKAMAQAESQWQQASGAGYGQGRMHYGPFSQSSASGPSEYDADPLAEADEAVVDRSEYSAAEDVSYREIKE